MTTDELIAKLEKWRRKQWEHMFRLEISPRQTCAYILDGKRKNKMFAMGRTPREALRKLCKALELI